MDLALHLLEWLLLVACLGCALVPVVLLALDLEDRHRRDRPER